MPGELPPSPVPFLVVLCLKGFDSIVANCIRSSSRRLLFSIVLLLLLPLSLPFCLIHISVCWSRTNPGTNLGSPPLQLYTRDINLICETLEKNKKKFVNEHNLCSFEQKFPVISSTFCLFLTSSWGSNQTQRTNSNANWVSCRQGSSSPSAFPSQPDDGTRPSSFWIKQCVGYF